MNHLYDSDQDGGRVLVAARLSRIVDSDGRSRIERDDESAQKWAAANGRTIVAVSTDAGVSGSTDPFKRPGLGPYLTDPVQIASYDEIVASSLDRLGRNARDLNRLRNWADDNGKRITILSPLMHWPVDPDDFASPIIWDVLGRVSEMELRMITKRIADNRDDLVERGSFVGKPCFGFDIWGERGDKTLIPNPKLAPYLRGMVDRARQGDTLLSICHWLDSEGIEPPKGGTWHPKSVSQILHNPSLKGRRYFTHKGKSRVLKHDGIISAADWQALQDVLDARPGHRGPILSKTAPLTGAIVCDLCGGPMYKQTSTTTRKDGSKYKVDFYRCHGDGKNPSRCRNGVNRQAVEDFVDDWFTQTGAFAHTPVMETVVVKGHNHEDEIADVKAEIAQLDPDDDGYMTEHGALMADLARLKGLPYVPTRIDARPTGQTVGQVWASLSDDAKRRYLASSNTVIRVRPVKDGVPDAAWLYDDDAEPELPRHFVYMTGETDHIAGTLGQLQAAAA